MSYFDWLESRLDYITGRPCANCESDPAEPDSLFCSGECADEYNGEGDYAETDGVAESIDATYAIRQDTD